MKLRTTKLTSTALTISVNLPIGEAAADNMRQLAAALDLAAKAASVFHHTSLAPGAVDVEAFISERCERRVGEIEARDLFAAYIEWARAVDKRALSQKAFSRAIIALGFSRRKSSRMLYCGLRLRAIGPDAVGGRLVSSSRRSSLITEDGGKIAAPRAYRKKSVKPLERKANEKGVGG
jgi:hypothetical protein